MTFDEIQAIWDSQQSIHGKVDREELENWIRVRAGGFHRSVGVVELLMTCTLLFVGAMFLKDPLLQGHDRILIVPGILSFAVAVFVWTGRIARKKREVAFDDSLSGIVRKALDGIDHHIQRMRRVVWWITIPCGLGLAIGLLIISPEKRHLLWGIFIPAFVACMGLAAWQVRREVRLKLLPERQRLEELLRSLNEE